MENNQNQSLQTRQSSDHSQDLTSATNKRRQIAYLVRQSYDIFRTYGAEPSQLDSLNTAFIDVLERYSLQQITSAFRIWRDENDTMPTPADIRKIVLQWATPEPEYNDEPPRVNDSSQLTEEQWQELDSLLASIRTPEEKKKYSDPESAKRCQENWDKLDANHKSLANKAMVDGHKKLLEGKQNYGRGPQNGQAQQS